MTTDIITQRMSDLYRQYCVPFTLLDEDGDIISTEYCWKNETAHQLYDNLRKCLPEYAERYPTA